jgi:multiple sugar transport system ATP-binding protein
VHAGLRCQPGEAIIRPRPGRDAGRSANENGCHDVPQRERQMASVEIRKVDKYFGSMHILHAVEIDIPDGEFVVLVGPSGCGKSTLLRMVAGLEEITNGDIAIGGRVVNRVPPKDRDIAMVFQNYALYPHMTVRQNMAFSLKLAKAQQSLIDERVGRAAAILGLETLLERYPRQLSGGQRQRVAMGRAIVRDPQVFLFDEPLSNLDAKLRVQMRTEIKELHQRLKTTAIYVTHDQIEAMTMADRIVVMQHGVVEQMGAPLELYDRPANLFVAGFIGSPSMNFIDARVHRNGGLPVAVATDGTSLPLPDRAALEGASDIVYGIRPEHLHLRSFGEALPAEVVVVEPTGAETLVVTRVAGIECKAVFRERHQLAPGVRIGLEPQLDQVHLFDRATGRRLLQ